MGRPVSQPELALTPRISAVMLVARYEAEVHGKCSPHGGHLLMALAWENGGIAAHVLNDLGVSLAHSMAATQQQSVPLGEVIARAADEARSRGHDYIGTEHALLALARADEALLAPFATLDQIEAAVEHATD